MVQDDLPSQTPESNNTDEQKPAKKLRRSKYADWEIAYIQENYRSKTDKEIAEYLNRSEDGILQQRRSLGLVKPTGRPSQEFIESQGSEEHRNLVGRPMEDLEEEERALIIRGKLMKSPRAQFLKKQLTQDEMDYYLLQWIRYESSLNGNLQPIEEESLHGMIMEEITVAQLTILMKQSQNDLNVPQLNYYKEINDAKERIAKYQKNLNASREQRIKREGGDAVNIVTIVQDMLKRREKEKAGKEAGIMEYVKEQEIARLKDSQNLIGDL